MDDSSFDPPHITQGAWKQVSEIRRQCDPRHNLGFNSYSSSSSAYDAGDYYPIQDPLNWFAAPMSPSVKEEPINTKRPATNYEEQEDYSKKARVIPEPSPNTMAEAFDDSFPFSDLRFDVEIPMSPAPFYPGDWDSGNQYYEDTSSLDILVPASSYRISSLTQQETPNNMQATNYGESASSSSLQRSMPSKNAVSEDLWGSSDATERKSKKKPPLPIDNVFDDPCLFKGTLDVGPWQSREECLLLHILYCFLSAELRVIAAVAWKCKIHRPKRAIDKKVKRLLKFSKWRLRNLESTKAELAQIIHDCKYSVLPDTDLQNLQQVRTEFLPLGLSSNVPLQLDTEYGQPM